MAELNELLRFLVSYCASRNQRRTTLNRTLRVACLRVSQAWLRLKTRAAVRTQSGPAAAKPKAPKEEGCPPDETTTIATTT